MNIPFNPSICHSIKTKKEPFIQCTNKKASGEVFCKNHLKTKYTTLYKCNELNECIECINNENYDEPILQENCKLDNEREMLYEKDDFFDLFLTNKCNNLTVYVIRKNIKNLGLLISTKQSKSELIKDIKRLMTYNVNKIILIQSVIRKWLIYRRNKCCNKEEITSFDSIFDISPTYFYLFKDKQNGLSYGYDIRSLVSILKSDYQSCPYTYRHFTDEEKERINKFVKKIKDKGVSLSFDKMEFTPEQAMEMRMKDIFHKINMLDNYTSHTWFNNLSLNSLVTLYNALEDIWNYRLGMTPEAKSNILPSTNGNAFTLSVNSIKRIKNKLQLQDILLTEIDKFISDGINRDERKLGAMVILTGLVEVSDDAADGLPHLVPY